MVEVDQQVFAIATVDGRLRVEFRRKQDRFAHRVLLDQVEVARSVEGDPSDPWPDSPPLQQLSLEQIKGTETILAVGSAGRSHWSLSVEIEPNLEGPSRVRFDLAARCRDHPSGGIRSTYLAADSIFVEPSEGDSMQELIEDRDEKRGWRKVSIRPRQANGEAVGETSRAATFRWSYQIVAAG